MVSAFIRVVVVLLALLALGEVALASKKGRGGDGGREVQVEQNNANEVDVEVGDDFLEEEVVQKPPKRRPRRPMGEPTAPAKPTRYHSWAEPLRSDDDEEDDLYQPGGLLFEPSPEDDINVQLKHEMTKPALGIAKLYANEKRTKHDAENIAFRWREQLLTDHLDVQVTSIDADTIIVYTGQGTHKYRVKAFLQQQSEIEELTLD